MRRRFDSRLAHRFFPACLAAAAAAGLLAAVGLKNVSSAGGPPAGPAAGAPVVRIGTYESRAIAVAYAHSALLKDAHAELLRRREEARQAGDEQAVADIEVEAGALQARLHLQGFSTAPVDDLLDAVRDRLPEVAAQSRVVAIARAVDFRDASVEVVDVTDQVAALFQPDPKAFKVIAELRRHKPMAIEAAARMDHGRD